MRKILIFVLAAVLLAGCKAKDVEVRISSQDIQDALSGEEVRVRFIARFENYGSLDEEKRAQLDAIQDIVEANLEIDDYNLVTDSSKMTITVEGEIPIHVGQADTSPHAFAITVWPRENPLLPGFTHALQLNTGAKFGPMHSQMKGISYMLAIDEVQPVTYRLRANSDEPISVLAGGGQIDGNSFAVRAFTLNDGERINLNFNGGAYDKIFGGLLIGLP